MRLLEIKSLLESGLTASDMKPGKDSAVLDSTGKKLTRLELFLRKVKTKSPFETTDGRQVVIDPKEVDKIDAWIKTGPSGKLKLNLLGGGAIETGKLVKTAEFGGKTGEQGEGKVTNRGEIAEGLMGASLFAKMSARVNKTIAPIGVDDVWSVIDQLRTSGADEYAVKMRDASKAVVNDSIIYTLRLKAGPYGDLMNPTKRQVVDDLVRSVVAFANSPAATEYCEYFYLNGKPDIINIIADGVTEEKSSKVDVKVVVTDAKTGKRSERMLNLSLKADAAQFGQVGGGEAKIPGSRFESQKTLWNRFGIDVDSLKEDFENLLAKKGLMQAIFMMYANANDMFRELLSGDHDEEEYLYIKDFVNAINYFATLNMPNVLLVTMERGTYDVLNFDLLEDKLKEINLTSRYNELAKNPTVEIYDANSGKVLLKVRSKIEGGTYLRNYIEKGPLMSELISVRPDRVKK